MTDTKQYIANVRRPNSNVDFGDLSNPSPATIHKIVDKLVNTDKHFIFHGQAGCGAIMVARRMAALFYNPFRAPHHTTSSVGMLGKPNLSDSLGEVHLAAGGILYLSDVMDFSLDLLEDVAKEAYKCNTRIVAMYHTDRIYASIEEIDRMKEAGDKSQLILLTKDTALRIKADAYGVDRIYAREDSNCTRLLEKRVDAIHEILNISPDGDDNYFYIPTQSYADMKRNKGRGPSNEELRNTYIHNRG